MIRRLAEMDADQKETVKATSEEPTVIFDPAKLTAQLSELLELYLARAKEALLEEQMSSKEAVACAKQVASMMEDTQSGKLARVDTTTHWPRLEFAPAAFVGRGPVPRRLTSCRDNHGGPQVAALQDPPIQTLTDAVTAVCQYDEETAILEPWERVLIRLNQLTRRLSADVEAWKASCEEHTPNGVGRADQPGSSATDTEAGSESDGGAGGGGTGVPPVIPPKPAQSSTGGAPFGSEPQGRRQVPALLQDSLSVQQPKTDNQQPASGYT